MTLGPESTDFWIKSSRSRYFFIFCVFFFLGGGMEPFGLS